MAIDAELLVRILLAVSLLTTGFLGGVFLSVFLWLDGIERRAYRRGHDAAVRWCLGEIRVYYARAEADEEVLARSWSSCAAAAAAAAAAAPKMNGKIDGGSR